VDKTSNSDGRTKTSMINRHGPGGRFGYHRGGDGGITVHVD
jgi:hypothetical protein